MKVQSFLAMAMAIGMVSGGCGSGSSSGSGGSPGSGGSTTAKSGGASGSGGATSAGGATSNGGNKGTGGATSSGGSTAKGGASGNGGAGGAGGDACANPTTVAPCGGDVVGTWTVTPSCMKVSGNIDLTDLGIGCTSATISGTIKVSGTWTAGSDGKYTDKTVTTGQQQIALPASCLEISGTTTTCLRIGDQFQSFGYSSVTCVDASSGGGCTCTATIDQNGSAGIPYIEPPASSKYTISGNDLSTGLDTKYSFCATGNQLALTPQSKAPLTGSIVLQKGTGAGGAGGAGGATGGGGTTGQGGKTGGGGSTAQGGATGGGGTTAQGGKTGSGGSTAVGGTTGNGGATGGGSGNPGPCDIYADAKTPCAAAYSMVRVLTKTYTGPLYQVRNGSSSSNTGTGGTTKDIGAVDGYADTATQDAFCTSTCTVSILYDQSGNKNDLTSAPKGLTNGGTYAATDDFESSATKGAVTAGGHKVYSLYMAAREGYRTAVNVKGKNMPLGNSDEGIYELADGTHYGTACCWDFGNVSPDPTKYGVMNTLFFGTGYWGTGAPSGPWFLGDFEGGVWAGGSGDSKVNNPNNPSMKVPFALGILKTSTPNKYALRMADVQKATDLTTAYDGTGPKSWSNEGGIVLGVGGDNSNNSWGTFYEGAITIGRPSDATDLAIMKNIQAVGYTK